MKKLRIALRLRSYFYFKQLIKRTRSIAVLALALIVLVYGSALAAYSRSDAGQINQANLLSLNQWMYIGPQEEIWALTIEPINPNVIYAGGRSGVFKSSDGGESWKNTGLGEITVALAIDYTNPNIIYAGKWKSTDGGATWIDTGLIDFDISLLVMDPTSPTTLYAGSLFRYQEMGGIILWKTTDGGGSWDALTGQQVGPDSLGLSTYGWAFNRAEPQTIYASGILVFHPSTFDPGLFKSTDGGTSWSSTGLNGTLASVVAIDPSNPDTLYAGTVTNGYNDLTFRGLLKSTDAGESWLAINDGLSHLLGTSSHISSLIIDPLDPNTLYAGTRGHGVFRSTDGGASWSEFNVGLTNLYINALAIDSSGTNLYVATSQGVFRYQIDPTCAAQVSPTSQLFSSMGGAGSVNLATGSGCSWAVSNNAEWITLTSAATGEGPATVTFEVRENFTASPRATTLLIAGQSFTVVQDGGSGEGCDYLIPARFQTFSAAGGTATINVSTGNRCAWQAASNMSWITITSNGVGIGNGAVGFSVAANTTGSGRKGSITIAGQTVAVKQGGS
jgi:hypothetical protein